MYIYICWYFGQYRPFSVAESGRNYRKHIYRPRPFIWAYFQVSTTIRYRETAWKSLCLEKQVFLDILANFGHFRWPNLAKTIKRHIYRPRPLTRAYFQVSTTIRYKETARKSLCLEKPMFLDILPNFGNFRWPNLTKTIKRHIYRSRPFIWAYFQVSTTIHYKAMLQSNFNL